MYWDIKYTPRSADFVERRKEILDHLLINRGLSSNEDIDAFLHPRLPLDITLTQVGLEKSAVEKAITIIKCSVQQKMPILIYGDYDADGVTATAIMWELVRFMGGDAIPFIPNRERHGYGLSIKGLTEALGKVGSKCLVVTVDNGIVANEPIAWLKQQGHIVIVTDHHAPGNMLPPADVIVHSTTVCGAGVAWMMAKTVDSETARQTLDLVCIGTIADMMPTMGINRSFIAHGLAAVRDTKRCGLQALMKEAQVDLTRALTPYTIGFSIAPRINAMGRMEDALDSLRILCTTSAARAEVLAKTLGDTNKTRQDLTLDLLMHAKNKLKDLNHQRVIVIDDEIYHEGVIGLIAGKLVETYYRPTIVISRKDGISKASARSIPGVNITELIRSQSHLLAGVGGHPMAAGFSIETTKIDQFSESLIQHSESVVDESLLVPTLKIDCEISFDDVTEELYHDLEKLQPYGVGNSQPLFALRNVACLSSQAMGSSSQHLKLLLKRDNDLPIEALWFGHGNEASQLFGKRSVDIACTIDQNTWRGKTKLQLLVKSLRYQSEDSNPSIPAADIGSLP